LHGPGRIHHLISHTQLLVIALRKEYQKLRQHEQTSRPLGSDLLIDKLEVLLEKQLRKKKTGSKGPWKNIEP